VNLASDFPHRKSLFHPMITWKKRLDLFQLVRITPLFFKRQMIKYD